MAFVNVTDNNSNMKHPKGQFSMGFIKQGKIKEAMKIHSPHMHCFENTDINLDIQNQHASDDSLATMLSFVVEEDATEIKKNEPMPKKYADTEKELMQKIKEMVAAMKKLAEHHAKELALLSSSI